LCHCSEFHVQWNALTVDCGPFRPLPDCLKDCESKDFCVQQNMQHVNERFCVSPPQLNISLAFLGIACFLFFITGIGFIISCLNSHYRRNIKVDVKINENYIPEKWIPPVSCSCPANHQHNQKSKCNYIIKAACQETIMEKKTINEMELVHCEVAIATVSRTDESGTTFYYRQVPIQREVTIPKIINVPEKRCGCMSPGTQGYMVPSKTEKKENRTFNDTDICCPSQAVGRNYGLCCQILAFSASFCVIIFFGPFLHFGGCWDSDPDALVFTSNLSTYLLSDWNFSLLRIFEDTWMENF